MLETQGGAACPLEIKRLADGPLRELEDPLQPLGVGGPGAEESPLVLITA